MVISNSVQSLYDKALKIIQEHNDNLGENANETKGYVNPDSFIKCLKATGGTTEDRLRRLRYEDIVKCLPACQVGIEPGKSIRIEPILLAKDIAAVFRGRSQQSNEKKRPSKVKYMSATELIEHYDPKDSNNQVALRLAEIARCQPFIVFDDTGYVNNDITLKLLKELSDGYNSRKNYKHEDKIYKVHDIGECPKDFVDENPIFLGRPLRPDGTCDVLDRSWDGIAKENRQFIAFLIKHPDGPTVRDDLDKTHSLFDLIEPLGKDNTRKEAKEKLFDRYKNVVIDFEEAKQLGKLNPLLMSLTTAKQRLCSSKKGQVRGGKIEKEFDPFSNGKKVK